MALNVEEKQKEYEKLVKEIVSCTKCPLYKTRKNPVVGEGPLDTKIMFVGEAPGRQEDETGRPFVGAAGKLLTTLIEDALGIKRSEVYITNILKCRPPGNRDPREDEIRACTPYLWRQIRLIEPRVIVALGRFAGRTLFEKAGLVWRSMKAHRGRTYKAVIEGVEVVIIPTYHPAAALYNPTLRTQLESDFRNVIRPVVDKVLGRARETEKRETKQRTLFDFLKHG
ncbi:phage SPO1 DNA polymerase-related protein [Pyrolobus fumarii 1A]|uniref:Type-4 uracil-DNA glycosylase n=1 Tax=Pyrolobus fumarii (strain DSM 11204 / 1A) TaxID=694429 RepID=G0EEG8_PYRF1|nr:type-4 uracil-DNA glycosylase [Pyrolobus fumarii]AEM38009.1 phage SPO1 DNA polymerase-related protein [Pyrolobus fumarii 1A]